MQGYILSIKFTYPSLKPYKFLSAVNTAPTSGIATINYIAAIDIVATNSQPSLTGVGTTIPSILKQAYQQLAADDRSIMLMTDYLYRCIVPMSNKVDRLQKGPNHPTGGRKNQTVSKSGPKGCLVR